MSRRRREARNVRANVAVFSAHVLVYVGRTSANSTCVFVCELTS